MSRIEVPRDVDAVLDDAWRAAREVPGFLSEAEARFLGMAASVARGGAIAEIGSFKGKSTVMLARVAARYDTGPVVAIDPHTFHNSELSEYRSSAGASSFEEFETNLKRAGVADRVEVRRAFSHDVGKDWDRPIAFLWIDGDHTFAGAKTDFETFLPYVVPGGIVAFHDALHEFEGPIRVFVESVLRSDRFGAAGFVHSIAWAQFRPEDGSRFHRSRAKLAETAARLIPFLTNEAELRGIRKLLYKLNRARVPRTGMTPGEWETRLGEEDRGV